MCGIAGVLDLGGGTGLAETPRRMLDALAHRGPDGEGIYHGDGATLAMRRLAIIDLAGGNQPMATEDQRLWVVQNGEIYNYIELRRELEPRHAFKTQSDTEVILHLYEERGVDCVSALRGMFTIALWDARTQQLMLARDRLGKKPLYYARQGGKLVFASEIKAILASGLVETSLDESALYQYLCFGFIPHPRTIYREIRSLPPGHILLAEAGGDVRINRYWRLPGPSAEPPNRAQAVERTRELLTESVGLRLRSDVPVGIFLSGGIDSGLVTAAASRATDAAVRTFSIGFADKAFDEREHARLVAQRYGTTHTEIEIDLAEAVRDPDALLGGVVAAYDQPYADSSAIPSMAVSREARKYVTVVLNGDGGDEAFAGYRRYSAALMADWMTTTLGPVAPAAARLAPAPRRRRGPVEFALRLLEGVKMPPRERYLRWSGLLTDADAADLIQPSLARELEESAGDVVDTRVEQCLSWGYREPAALMMACDTTHVLVDDFLVKMDIATMAASVEGRSPFLDHVLVEYASSLPDGVRASAFQTKPILREIAKDWLPAEITKAPKRGFEVPMARWLRTELRPVAQASILAPDARIREYVRPKAVARMWDDHLAERRDHAMRLWSLLVLEWWLRR
ncbi:MAG: asparagine synthase (glutamine-hydrolyzing) [Chloroflexota bacterium]